MSKSALSNVLKAHIINNMKKNAEDYFDAKKLRKTTMGARAGQTSVETRESLRKLAEDFDTKSGNITFYRDNKPLSLEEAAPLVSAARDALNKLDFDEFSNWVISEKFLKDTTANITSGPALTGSRNTYYGMIDRFQQERTAVQQNSPFNYQNPYAVMGKDLSTPNSGTDILLLKNVEHGKINEYIVEYLRVKKNINQNICKFISDNLQAGHLTGIAAIRAARFLNLPIGAIDASGNIGLNDNGEIDRLLTEEFDTKILLNNSLSDTLKSMMRLITDSDFVSSNLINHHSLMITTDKQVFSSDPRVTTEAQLKFLNEASGRALATIGAAMSDLVKSKSKRGSYFGIGDSETEAAYSKAMNSFLSGMQEIATSIEKQGEELKKGVTDTESIDVITKALANASAIKELLNSEGSPSIIDSIGMELASILKNNKKLTKVITPTIVINEKIMLPTIDKIKQQNGKLLKDAADSIENTIKELEKKNKELQKAKASVKKQVLKSKTASKPTRIDENKSSLLSNSLPSLQQLINQRLASQIRSNMGTGERRDILNYRTGRFAESVEIKRMSQSRQGLITAFYSYMKNPYATFSEGGIQGFPPSRDPKLLISKSIRQIAAELVSNRMRAVLV